MRAFLLLTLAVILPASVLASDRWVRLANENAESRLKNHVRLHMGAFQMDPMVEPQPDLLRDDPILGASSEAGASARVIELAQLTTVNRFSMLNDGGAGKVSIYGATTLGEVNEGRWTLLGTEVFEVADEAVEVRFGATDAGYVRVDFDMAQPGDVYEMAVFGNRRNVEYGIMSGADYVRTAPASARNPGRLLEADLTYHDFNLTRIYSGGRVPYVSGGRGDAVSIIDNDVTTRYVFSKSDSEPTIIAQLGQTAEVDRFTALMATSEPGTLLVYVLDSLPEERNWAGRPSLSDDFLDDLEPSAIHRNVNGAGRFEALLEPTIGRYVAVRFIPVSEGIPDAENPPGVRTTFVPLNRPELGIENDGELLAYIAIGVFSESFGRQSGGKGGGKDVIGGLIVGLLDPGRQVQTFRGPRADFTPGLFPRVNSVSP